MYLVGCATCRGRCVPRDEGGCWKPFTEHSQPVSYSQQSSFYTAAAITDRCLQVSRHRNSTLAALVYSYSRRHMELEAHRIKQNLLNALDEHYNVRNSSFSLCVVTRLTYAFVRSFVHCALCMWSAPTASLYTSMPSFCLLYHTYICICLRAVLAFNTEHICLFLFSTERIGAWLLHSDSSTYQDVT